MEVVEQQRAPRAVELLARPRRVGDGGQQLGVVQGALRAPARALGARLRGVRAAVVLEVELADHLGPLRLGGQRREEGLRVADRRARDVLQVPDPRERLEHLRRRAAATVAPAEDEQAARRQRVVLEVARRAAQLGHGRLGVVGVRRREVREHGRAVDPHPAEGVVLGRVEAVPRELLREEAVDPGAAHDLRQLAVVAEDVRVPEHACPAPELVLEEALAVEELAHQRLPGRQVAVRLDPRAADREPLPGGDPLADPRPQPGRAVTDPRVLLGLRAGEAVVGVALHEPQLGGEGPHALAEGLLQRPQPRRVDVGVTDGGDLVRPGRVAPLLQQRAEHRAGAQPRRAVRGVPDVAEAIELAQQLAPPGVVEARLAHERDEDVEVAGERPRLAVEARQRAALQAKRWGGRDRLVGLGMQVGPPEEPVAGDLDARAQRLTRRRARGEHRVGADVRAPADQALDRLAVDPQRGLGVGDEQEVDLLALPLRGHARLHRQPPRRPQRAERHPRRRVAVLERGRLGGRDAADRSRDPHAVGRPRVGVHELLCEARDLAHALARVVRVGEQGRDASAATRPRLSPRASSVARACRPGARAARRARGCRSPAR